MARLAGRDEVTGALAVLTLAAEGTGTRYTAMAIHRDEATRKRHEEMGFHRGGTALDQLVALMKPR